MKRGDVVVIKAPAPGVEFVTEEFVGGLGVLESDEVGPAVYVRFDDRGARHRAFWWLTKDLELLESV
jgi:hypothetical protein